MFDFLCFFFGKTLITPIIKFADDKLICERVQLDSLHKTHGEFTIRISSTDEHTYKSRLRTDLEKGMIHGCLNNNQMRYREYRDMFLDVVKDLDVDVKKRIVYIKDENGITSFLISCLRDYEELVDFFISVGADVNARNGWFTPLTAACRDGHLGTVEILLNKGSVINQTNTDGETPLYTACICCHYGLVKLLIERRADINKKDKYGRTPLYVSCLAGFENIVRILIDKGANIYDSLIGATHGGHDKIVETLITENCDLNIVDSQGRTALFVASEEGFTKIVTLLIDKHADISKASSDGKTPLDAAFCARNNEIVNILIKNNADVNIICADGETPLPIACNKGFGKQTPFANVADVYEANRSGLTPSNLREQEGQFKDGVTMKTLKGLQPGQAERPNISEGLENNYQNQNTDTTNHLLQRGWTPLYEACMREDIQTVQSLVKFKANVNMTTVNGETPLVAACLKGNGTLIDMLLNEGADINQALCSAVQVDYDRAVRILLDKGGDLGYKGHDWKSLIKIASEHGSINSLKLLLEKDKYERDLTFVLMKKCSII